LETVNLFIFNFKYGMRSELKITGIKLIKFIVLVFLMDTGLGFVAKQLFQNQSTGKYARAQYAIYESTEDVLILGSSHAHRNYIPEIIENTTLKSCFNAGAEGQQLLYHAAMIKMILKRTRPEIIILNMDENFLYTSEIGHQRLSDLHPFYSDFKKELKPYLIIKNPYLDITMLFNAYQTNSTLVHAIKYYVFPQITEKGYRPLYGWMSPKKINEYNKNMDDCECVKIIDNQFVDILKDLIKTIKDKNIKLVMVTSPNLIKRDLKNNLSLKIIKEIARSEQIPFLDVLNHPDYVNNYKLFHDPSHLNNDGAKLFTLTVAQWINSLN